MVYPQHVSQYLKTPSKFFHYKTIRKFNGLISKQKTRLILLEIYDTF